MRNEFINQIIDKDICKTLCICGSNRIRILEYTNYCKFFKNRIYNISFNEDEPFRGHEKETIRLSDGLIVVNDKPIIQKDIIDYIILAYQLNKKVLYTNIFDIDEIEKYYVNDNNKFSLYMSKEEYK